MSCELNKIFLGEVASVQNYGAFIRIPGTSQQGLVHKTQISSARVDDVSEVLERGDKIWCKVISIDDEGKIGLSMKYVNQKTGKDLDENCVQRRIDLRRKKSAGPTQRTAIRLEAVYNTTCNRCGTHGHLANNCFVSPDGKKYELILDEEDSNISKLEGDGKEKEEEEKRTKRKRKEKKSKKRKKEKKKTVDSDDSDEDDEPKKKKKKKHSVERKHKKRKKMESDNDSDSNGSNHNSTVRNTKRRHSESKEIRTKKCKYSKTKRPD